MACNGADGTHGQGQDYWGVQLQCGKAEGFAFLCRHHARSLPSGVPPPLATTQASTVLQLQEYPHLCKLILTNMHNFIHCSCTCIHNSYMEVLFINCKFCANTYITRTHTQIINDTILHSHIRVYIFLYTFYYASTLKTRERIAPSPPPCMQGYCPLGSPGSSFAKVSVLEHPVIKDIPKKLQKSPAQVQCLRMQRVKHVL